MCSVVTRVMSLIGVEGPQRPGDSSIESGLERLGDGHGAARQHPHVLRARAPAARPAHPAQRVLHLAAQLQPVRVAFQITGNNRTC